MHNFSGNPNCLKVFRPHILSSTTKKEAFFGNKSGFSGACYGRGALQRLQRKKNQELEKEFPDNVF